jgi:exopolyphosphatase/guanosine-5'-triphosphate,3'-diphosphate pyrophosphatase
MPHRTAQPVSAAPDAMHHEGRIGIIDIGSNSIRLVIYDGIKRTPKPLYNEKVFCGLGKGLELTGKLNPDAVKCAKQSIARLLTIVRLMDVTELKIMATAAIRDAKDGAVFVDYIEQKHQVHVSVISGKREAQLAASGVMASFFHPQGLVGDMGGGSIELIHLKDKTISQQDTLPIGPLRMIDASGGDRAVMKKLIAKRLDGLKWLSKTKPAAFFAIGGSFRAIARIHMELSDYPLHVIHHYTVRNADLLQLVRRILKMREAQIAKLPQMSSRRVPSMVPTCLILEYLLTKTKVPQVVFSTSGIREGYLHEKLSPYIKAEDPLIGSALELTGKTHAQTGYAKELYHWMSPLFVGEDIAHKRLRMAFCLLSEIGDRMHPEYRAEWAFHHLLQSTLTGVDHRERTMIALALYHRYQIKLKDEFSVLSLVTAHDRLWAKVVGIAGHLAYHLSGAMTGNLAFTRFRRTRGSLSLQLLPEVEDLMSDTIRKRMDGLGDAFKAFSKRRK